jgi:hypothetical protein
MAGDKGIDESSEAVSQPPGASAAAGSRTVFLSYASPDAAVANQVCEYLESHGVSCWMAPRDVLVKALQSGDDHTAADAAVKNLLDKGRIAPIRTPEFAVKTTFYTEQKNLLNQYITKLHPEIRRRETGPSTGTFGT